jgi:hypothetical protein
MFKWEKEQPNALDNLKEWLTTTSGLAYPNEHDQLILDTGASNTAIGAELSQIQNGQCKVIYYGSYQITPQQRKYCTTEKELLD